MIFGRCFIVIFSPCSIVIFGPCFFHDFQPTFNRWYLTHVFFAWFSEHKSQSRFNKENEFLFFEKGLTFFFLKVKVSILTMRKNRDLVSWTFQFRKVKNFIFIFFLFFSLALEKLKNEPLSLILSLD
jgi:hypothetical protein